MRCLFVVSVGAGIMHALSDLPPAGNSGMSRSHSIAT